MHDEARHYIWISMLKKEKNYVCWQEGDDYMMSQADGALQDEPGLVHEACLQTAAFQSNLISYHIDSQNKRYSHMYSEILSAEKQSTFMKIF